MFSRRIGDHESCSQATNLPAQTCGSGDTKGASFPICRHISPFASNTAFAPGCVSYAIASRIWSSRKVFPIFVRNSGSATCVWRYSSAFRNFAGSRTVVLLKLLKVFIVRFFAINPKDGTETGGGL